MPDSQQPLHEVVRALLGLRLSLQVHGAAWWALERELYDRYGRQEVEAEFKHQLDVRHGYVEDIKRPANEAAIKDGFLRASIWIQRRMDKNNDLPYADQVFAMRSLMRQAVAGGQLVEDALIEAQHIRADKAAHKQSLQKPKPRTGHVIPEAGPLPASRLVKPAPPKGRVQMESEPPPEAGAQMCHACNGTGEVQGDHGPEACIACNGEGTVTQ